MSPVYTCSRCGVVSATFTGLCLPQKLDSRQDFCGHSPRRGNLCREMKQHLRYVCSRCGRPAEQAEIVCDPVSLG